MLSLCVIYIKVSVFDAVKKTKPVDVTLKLEPSILALGTKHIAAGMNNRVYFHRIAPNPSNAGTKNRTFSRCLLLLISTKCSL
jgi:hypothetical protein